MLATLILISTVLAIVCLFFYRQLTEDKKVIQIQDEQIKELRINYSKILNQKKSSEVLTGHIAEKLAPLISAFSNYDLRDTVSLGMPIDYINFGDNEITFLEVKSGKSQLTLKQKKIKELINQKKVKWDVIRITGENE